MANYTGFTVGLLCTMSPELHDVWGEEVRAPSFEQFAEARRVLESFGARVVDPGEFTTSYDKAAEHGRLLRSLGATVLVVFVARWSYGTSAVAAAAECGVPVIIWSGTDVKQVGLVGASVCRGSLDEAGITNCLVYGDFDDPDAIRDLEIRCKGAAAGTRLRGQKYGLMGSRSLGMLTASIDANQWRRNFGIEVESWDQLEVIEKAKALPDSLVEQHVQWTYQEFGSIQVKPDVLRAGIKIYIAAKEIIGRNGFDFVSVRCLPETPEIFTTFCYAIALLNDTSDAEGEKEAVCCSCESDSNGALTMQILKHLGGAPVMFGDVRTVRLQDGEVWISNCGSQATLLAGSRRKVHWVPHGFQEFKWKIGGAAPQTVAKPGRVTLARLTRVAGDYVMLIAGGESQDYPLAKLEETYWGFSPHAFVRLDADPRRFAQELRSNHLTLVYGDFVPHLLETCRILGIRPIVVDPAHA
jgi:L-fucose/D-arabinose isomerase